MTGVEGATGTGETSINFVVSATSGGDVGFTGAGLSASTGSFINTVGVTGTAGVTDELSVAAGTGSGLSGALRTGGTGGLGDVLAWDTSVLGTTLSTVGHGVNVLALGFSARSEAASLKRWNLTRERFVSLLL